MDAKIGRLFDIQYPESQSYGVNPDAYAQYGMAGHNGIDYAVPLGTTIYAGVNGKVVGVGNDPNGYGMYVNVVDSSQNTELIYAHLIGAAVRVGQAVTPGTRIGASGSTGNSSGPHLHLGVGETDIGGVRINRENGYDGWLNPANVATIDRTARSGGVASPGTTPASQSGAPPYSPNTVNQTVEYNGKTWKGQPGGAWVEQAKSTGEAGAPGYTGPERPPFAPNTKDQTVSYKGNSFIGQPGGQWQFQGSDAERKKAADAAEKKEYDKLVAKGKQPGVYIQKQNLSERMGSPGVYPWGGGLADAEWLVITGPFEARINTGKPGTTPWGEWYTENGRFALNGPDATTIRVEHIEVRARPKPPEYTVIPATNAPLSPGVTGSTSGMKVWPAWTMTKGPTQREIYNHQADIANWLAEAIGIG